MAHCMLALSGMGGVTMLFGNVAQSKVQCSLEGSIVKGAIRKAMGCHMMLGTSKLGMPYSAVEGYICPLANLQDG